MKTATLGLLCSLVPGLCGAGDAGWDMLNAKPEAVEAWKDMRFGMFVCWGPVSLTGLEIGWSRANRPGQPQGGNGPTPIAVYDNLYKKWKPDKFDARQWVKVAREMGAKYMIFLVKHHDGFCLYDTKLTDYKITGPESAWKHDVMKDVADACHEAGLKLIIYYSQPDWHHPDYKTANHARYNAVFPRPDPRAADQLRKDRRPVVRPRRVGQGMGRGKPLQDGAIDPAVAGHQQPRRAARRFRHAGE